MYGWAYNLFVNNINNDDNLRRINNQMVSMVLLLSLSTMVYSFFTGKIFFIIYCQIKI